MIKSNPKFQFQQTEHYHFLIDSRLLIPTQRFCEEIENRWQHLHTLFRLPSVQPCKTRYVVRMDPSPTVYGQAGMNQISCFLNEPRPFGPYLLPFLHEETHVLTQRAWGRLPAFWSEALADYALVSLEPENWLTLHSVLATALALMQKKSEEYTDLLWTLDDTAFWEKRRVGETGYAAASYLVSLLIDRYGICQLHRLMRMIGSRDVSGFRAFMLKEDIARQWFDALGQFLACCPSKLEGGSPACT